jgi:hypothetical protein
MIDADQQLEIARKTFREETADGTMISQDEMALAYMHNHPDFLKRVGTRRRRVANFLRRLRFRAPIEEKPTFKYSHQTSVALYALKNEMDFVFVDSNEQPIDNPKPPLSYKDRRYFPVKEEPVEAPITDAQATNNGFSEQAQLSVVDSLDTEAM